MITLEYCRLMARYNAWQNNSLLTAADALSDDQRWQDRGAFFKSVAATLNHLYWADTLQLQRIKGNERPHDNLTISMKNPSEWDEFKLLRLQRDEEIKKWQQAYAPLTSKRWLSGIRQAIQGGLKNLRLFALSSYLTTKLTTGVKFTRCSQHQVPNQSQLI